MHYSVFIVATIWLLGLAIVTVHYAWRARSIVVQTLALDMMTLILVAELAVVAVHRQESAFLDIALVLGMLGFVQTVATCQLIERRKDLR